MALVLREILSDLPFLLKSKTPALLKFPSYVYISDIVFFLSATAYYPAIFSRQVVNELFHLDIDVQHLKTGN